ncbi:glycosyltransferase family 4 protein [Mycolicibacterium hodleri]|uniref:Glycosyltransferase family 4 protein n=1 Tax=Mycolicibacterium hodleri TaxID=49897 RepID=A0A502DSW1_9MYCO|nr:glycosyltransferase family 4 protein [Mycolicibacterium hodleri]TPG27362.1 hypothetical protein EAH80_29020 [Mycolicibacterium hodleri]
MTANPTHLVVGPPRHGVVTFALDLAASLDRGNRPAPTVRVDDWTDLDGALDRVGRTDGVHLNFTDRLFGSTPRDAADRVVDLVGHFTSAGVRVTATLHDVPQPADGGNYHQRVAAYRTVCSAVHGRATNSEHERSLLAESKVARSADVVVVPLPLHLGEAPSSRPLVERRSVAVLGFLYPGKGHREVLAAMADLPRDVEFVAVGEPSAGHADLVEHLAESARAAGRQFTVTGYVPDEALSAAVRRVSVPIAHHRHVSASGSLNTWIAAHRRPLAPANRYTIEHAARHPGTLRLYPDTGHGMRDAIASALDDPDSTWLTADATSGSAPADTARLYMQAFDRWHD